ncbi:MAG: DNA-binding response regulator, partial [Candidatus Aenigmarchaeota archaeon]|nr:DNA-binding response regulator [Candidatus Aenigmarchaeota archaeon]
MAREKILIIDDEQDLVKLVKEILELERFRVSCAHDGEEGLKKA